MIIPVNSDTNTDHVNLSCVVAYSLPTIVTTFLSVPLINIVPGLYAKHFGITLSAIATIMLVARLFDAVTDPLIGYVSDRTQMHIGTRKPFVVAGGLLFIVSSYFIYMPPTQISNGYFLSCLLAFYLSWTLFEIPHLAWGSELTHDSREKTKVYSVRYFFINVGIFLFYVLPLMPFFRAKGFTLETMKWSVLISSVLMLPLIFVCIKKVPNGQQNLSQFHPERSSHSLLAMMIHNRPFLIFLYSYALSGIGIGIWMGVSFIFIDAYLKLGSMAPIIYTIATLVGLACVRLWYKFSSRSGKKKALSTGMILVSIAAAGTGFLHPGESSFLLISLMMSVIYAGSAVLFIVGPSLLADIVDYGTLKFGVNRAATYFSVYTFIAKTNAGLGGALGLGITAWYGFNPAEVNHAEEQFFGLRLAVSGLPVALVCAAVLFILKIPINERRHRVIQKRLAMRQESQFETIPEGEKR